MRYTYPCVLTPELDDGGISVSFPDVPEALTCGDDRAQALEKATDALAVALSFYSMPPNRSRHMRWRKQEIGS